MPQLSGDYIRRRKRWIFLCATLGLTGYGAYKISRSPASAVTKKKNGVIKLFRCLISIADAASGSAETVGVVSGDVKAFLQSRTDQIPRSLKQVSKIATAEEFTGLVTEFSRAITRGFLSGYGASPGRFAEQLLDRLFTTAGSAFASVVVGSFARNFATEMGIKAGRSELAASVCGSDRAREMIGDCVQTFVSTAVTVYLEKTMEINTYDEFFRGMTNPRHEGRVKEMMVTVCGGAVDTLVRTSHDVMTAGMNAEGESERRGREAVEVAWSALTVPRNRSAVLDVTGRVTSEMVRSILEFMFLKIGEGLSAAVHGIISVASAVAASSWAGVCLWLSTCLHVLETSISFLPLLGVSLEYE